MYTTRSVDCEPPFADAAGATGVGTVDAPRRPRRCRPAGVRAGCGGQRQGWGVRMQECKDFPGWYRTLA